MRDRASCKCAAAVVGLLAAAGLLTGCNTARVNPSVADTTPPRLTVTSFQLAPELGRAVSQVAQPSVVEYRVVLPTDHPEALISAVATDAESGVVSVQWRGELHAWCMPAWGSTVTPSKVSVAVAGPETVVSPAADGSLPTSASAGFTFVAAAVAAQCHNQVVADYLLELKAFARNGANRQTESIDVRVVRPVDVVVANLFAPCLRELENILGTELSYRVECEGLRIPPGSPPPPISDAPRRVPLNTVLDRWGTFFAQQDMVLLSELHESEARWLHRLQLHAPNHFVAHHGMTVILSRWPLSDIRGALSAPYTFPRWPLFIQSEHVHAVAALPQGPVTVYSLHWAHRPAPVESSQQRIDFAQITANEIRALPLNRHVILGGDLNAKSVWMAEPDELAVGDADTQADNRRQFADLNGRSQPDVAIIEGALHDGRRDVWENNRVRYGHDYGWPIDFLFLSRTMDAVTYTNRLGHFSTPSDHPWLRFEVLRR